MSHEHPEAFPRVVAAEDLPVEGVGRVVRVTTAHHEVPITFETITLGIVRHAVERLFTVAGRAEHPPHRPPTLALSYRDMWDLRRLLGADRVGGLLHVYGVYARAYDLQAEGTGVLSTAPRTDRHAC